MKKTSPTPKLRHESWEGESQELLKELHLLTREGQLNQDARRKLKQIYHLTELLKPALTELEGGSFDILDVGSGKSYLGFLLYDLWARKHDEIRLWGIESRADLVQKSEALAQKFGFKRMNFKPYLAEEFFTRAAQDIKSCGLVTALHACDTATDDAIQLGIKLQSKWIALVPCCQAEVAKSLSDVGHPSLSELWRHPVQTREFGSHLTNIIRGLYLEAHGYKVRVTELVGWEHSMKNEFILAHKIQASNPSAKSRLAKLLQEIPVEMKLLKSFA